MTLLIRRSPPARLSGPAAFWTVAVLLGFLLFAGAVPSPLYPVYQATWHFSTLTLTWIFAMYAFALLVALLFAGSLSDRVGRRPVLFCGLLAEAGGMALFAEARGVGWLLAARALQGFATGVATGTLSAALLDLQQPGRPGLAPLMSSTAPSLGLAAGALGAGAAVQYGPAPRHLVFWLLVAIFVLGAVATLALPDTVPFQHGWWHSLVPRVGVPPSARGAFLAISPSLVATWALSGLYLSLGSSLTISLMHSHNRLVSGLPVVALTGGGAIAAVATRRWPARETMLAGLTVLIVGVAATLLGIATGQQWLFLVGSAVAGMGFGPSFTGALRTLTPLAQPAERAGLLASVYVVSYLALGLPAVAAGFAVVGAGLRHTTYVYGAAVIALAALAAVGFAARNRRANVSMAPVVLAGPGHEDCTPCPGTVAIMPRRLRAEPVSARS